MVVVFGSINLDLVAKVARIPAPGETSGWGFVCHHARRQGREPGVGRTRAGARVKMFGAVGRDAFAAAALANLTASGIDLPAWPRSTPRRALH